MPQVQEGLENLTYTTVSIAPTTPTAGTELTLEGAPPLPAVPFKATVWPKGQVPTAANAEIIQVTKNSAGKLTIVRKVEGTTARAITAGDSFMASVTRETLKKMAESLLPVYRVDYYGMTSGDTDQTVALKALIKTVSEEGGGIISFPLTDKTKPWYRFLEVSIPGNVWIHQHPSVWFKPPTGELASNKTVLNLGEFGATGMVENISSIGLIKIDISEAKPHGSTLNIKACAIMGIKNCKLPGFLLIGTELSDGTHIGSEQGVMFTQPNANLLIPTNVQIDALIATKANCPGGGAIQATAHKNLKIGFLYSEGGIACRVETDSTVVTTAEQEAGKWRGSDGLSVDTLVCEKGFCAFSLLPHTNFIKGETSFGSVTANACSGGCYMGPTFVGEAEAGGNKGPLEGTVSIRSMSVNGEGATADPEFGSKTQGYFAPAINQEDFKFMQVKIGSLTVKKVTGNGAFIHANLDIGTCLLTECQEHGVTDRGEGNWLKDSYVHFGRLKMVNCNAAGGGSTRAMIVAGTDRIDIDDFEAIDSRGAENRMEYGLESFGAHATEIYIGRIKVEGGAGGTSLVVFKEAYKASGSAKIFISGTYREWENLTLNAAKVEADATLRVPACRLQPGGSQVGFRGAAKIKAAQTLTAGETLFTVPAACRPTAKVKWFVIYSGGTIHELFIESTGVATLSANLAAGESIDLDERSFFL